MKLIEIRNDGSTAQVIAPLPKAAVGVLDHFRSHFARVGFEKPWIGYLAEVVDDSSQATCVGTCAFKSPPVNGAVEIAYFTFPEFEGRGIATQMVKELLAIARTNKPDLFIIAQTLPVENASNAILKKFGFEFAGTVEHPEDGTVWEWRRPCIPNQP